MGENKQSIDKFMSSIRGKYKEFITESDLHAWFDRLSKTIVIPTGVKDDNYEIHMGTFHDKPADLLDMLIHINKKSWMTPELLSSTVEELVKKGFVERKPHPSDRRFILLELSQQGKKLTESINKDNDGFYLQVFQKIPLNKREDIIKKFEILVEAMGTSKQNKDKNNSCCE